MPDVDLPTLLERLAALPAAQRVLTPLLAAGRDAYVVGGVVRDLLLGEEPVDLDLIVPAGPEFLAEAVGAPIRRYDRFGTATLVLDGVRVDVARPRREVYERPGALPTVSPGTLEEDLGRRDFTVNAMALGVAGPAHGEFASATGALADLEQRVLRVLHPASFSDDPTRLLRLARYRARLGFTIAPETQSLAEQAVRSDALGTVSGNRLGVELQLLAAEPDPVAALRALEELGLSAALAPGLGLQDPARLGAALELLPGDGDRVALVLGAALTDVPEARARALLDRLAFSAELRDGVLAVRQGPRLAERLATAAEPSAVAEVVDGAPPEAVVLAGAYGAERAATDWLGRLRHIEPDISGHDLLDAGVPAGPAVGAGLRAALAAKLDGEAPDRAAQLKVACRVAGEVGTSLHGGDGAAG
jgi:tRNA nucleotidyltransferase (CCA-adding enzyme)